MKKYIIIIVILLISNLLFAADKINVVTTLSTYADIVKYIAKDKVNVQYIVEGDQDAHFVRPKPSFAVLLSKADWIWNYGFHLL